MPHLTPATPIGTNRTFCGTSCPPNSNGIRKSFSSSPRRQSFSALSRESISEKSGPFEGGGFFLNHPNIEHLEKFSLNPADHRRAVHARRWGRAGRRRGRAG